MIREHGVCVIPSLAQTAVENPTADRTSRPRCRTPVVHRKLGTEARAYVLSLAQSNLNLRQEVRVRFLSAASPGRRAPRPSATTAARTLVRWLKVLPRAVRQKAPSMRIISWWAVPRLPETGESLPAAFGEPRRSFRMPSPAAQSVSRCPWAAILACATENRAGPTFADQALESKNKIAHAALPCPWRWAAEIENGAANSFDSRRPNRFS